MNRNYNSFVERMGSFEVILPDSEEQRMSHYGILGMHWGRKASKISLQKKMIMPSEDHITKVTLKQKRIAEMSNAELKKFNERLQLERQYKDLSKKDVSRGQAFVTSILTEVAKDIAKGYVKKYAGEGIAKAVTKINKMK